MAQACVNTDFWNLRKSLHDATVAFQIRAVERGEAPPVKPAVRAGWARAGQNVAVPQALETVRSALQKVNQSPLRPAASLDLSSIHPDILRTMREFQIAGLRMLQTVKAERSDADWRMLQEKFETMTGLMAATWKIQTGSKLRNDEQQKEVDDGIQSRNDRLIKRHNKIKANAAAELEEAKNRSDRQLRKSRVQNYALDYSGLDEDMSPLNSEGSADEDFEPQD